MPPQIHVRLRAAPLDVAAAHAHVSHPGAGAVVLFTGAVRNHSDGRAVDGLDYEAYAEAAEERLRAVADGIADKWPAVTAVWLEHRLGALAVGEVAVVVAVSAPHRPDAFEAARYGIDTLKETVPIWKKEHWTDGGAHWPEA